MDANLIAKVITWATIAWVILVSYPKGADAGPATFAACKAQAAQSVRPQPQQVRLKRTRSDVETHW